MARSNGFYREKLRAGKRNRATSDLLNVPCCVARAGAPALRSGAVKISEFADPIEQSARRTGAERVGSAGSYLPGSPRGILSFKMARKLVNLLPQSEEMQSAEIISSNDGPVVLRCHARCYVPIYGEGEDFFSIFEIPNA
jgi:hypothetical protein